MGQVTSRKTGLTVHWNTPCWWSLHSLRLPQHQRWPGLLSPKHSCNKKKINKWIETADEWCSLFNPKWCFFTQWLHPGLRSLEHWVPSELLPSAAWVRKDRFNEHVSTQKKQTRTEFISSVHSPSWVWLRLCHIDRETFFLRCSFFKHPEDNSGVWVGQDFLWREHFHKFI